MAEWREEGMGRNGGKGREYEMNMKESIRKGMEWKGKEYEGMKVEWMSDLVHWGSCCFTKMIVVVSKNQHQKQVDGRNPAPVDIVKYPIIYINFNNMPRCFFFRDFWTKKQNEAAMFQEKRVPHLHINSAPPWGGEKKILFLLQKSWRSGFSLDVSKLIDEVDEVDSPKTSHQIPWILAIFSFTHELVVFHQPIWKTMCKSNGIMKPQGSRWTWKIYLTYW